MLPSGYGALRTVVRARCVSSGAFRRTRAKLCLVPLCAVCCVACSFSTAFASAHAHSRGRSCTLARLPNAAAGTDGVANALKLTAPLVNMYRMTGDWHGYDLPSPKGLPSRCLLGRSARNAPRAMYDATCSMHRTLCPPYCALAMQRARNRIGLAVVSVGMGRTATPAGPIISSWPVRTDLCVLRLALWVRPVDLSWLSHSVGPTL